MRRGEDGFTLVELMATIMLLSILLTLGVTALRYFWLGQALHRERDEIFTNLRALQQQVVAESNPLVFGAWFKVMTPETDDGSTQWGTVRYRPGAVPVCESTGQYHLDGTVQIRSTSFADALPGAPALTDVATTCASQVPASSGATDFVFFLARGTATAGCVTLTQPSRDMDDVAVTVSFLTGRVERLSEDEAETDPRCQ